MDPYLEKASLPLFFFYKAQLLKQYACVHNQNSLLINHFSVIAPQDFNEN